MLSDDDIADIEALIFQKFVMSYDGFQRALKASPNGHRWRGIFDPQAESFTDRALAAYRIATSCRSSRQRLQQLRDGNFFMWVFKSEACNAHSALDGLMLPPEHAFWKIFFPPNGIDCSCAVFGCRSVSGARRLGGDINKLLPSSAESKEGLEQLAQCLPTIYRTSKAPDLKEWLKTL